jgi:hypothetical protein
LFQFGLANQFALANQFGLSNQFGIAAPIGGSVDNSMVGNQFGVQPPMASPGLLGGLTNLQDSNNNGVPDFMETTKSKIDDYLAKTQQLGTRKLSVEVNYLNTPLEYQYLNQYHGFQHPLAGTPLGNLFNVPSPQTPQYQTQQYTQTPQYQTPQYSQTPQYQTPQYPQAQQPQYPSSQYQPPAYQATAPKQLPLTAAAATMPGNSTAGWSN